MIFRKSGKAADIVTKPGGIAWRERGGCRVRRTVLRVEETFVHGDEGERARAVRQAVERYLRRRLEREEAGG